MDVFLFVFVDRVCVFIAPQLKFNFCRRFSCFACFFFCNSLVRYSLPLLRTRVPNYKERLVSFFSFLLLIIEFFLFCLAFPSRY